MATTIAEVIADQLSRDPEEGAIQFHGKWYSRGWLKAFVDKIDAALAAAGVPEGAPIGFAPHNRPAFAAALVALFSRHRPIVMIYAYQSPEAIANKLRELKLPAVIAGIEQWTDPTLSAARDLGSAAIALSDNGVEVELLESWKAVPGVEQRKADGVPGVALLTSGTTGPPKHFEISYEKLLKRMVIATEFGASERNPLFSFFPLGNISGIYIIVPAIASGQPIIMVDKFNVADWVAFVKQYKPEFLGVPPAAFRMILDADVDYEDIKSIKLLNTGAATLDPALRREFEAKYPILVTQSYGATEFGGIVTITTPDHVKEFGNTKADSVGRACPGVKLRVVDVDTGEELSAGQEGRLLVFAPGMSEDYIETTDLVMLDADGFLYHRGRLDGAIMRGGFKIVPEQVMEALNRHPQVAASAVVGLAEPRLGAVPVALIQPRDMDDAPDVASLDAHVRSLLPKTMIPTDYRMVEALPRTPSLKIDMGAAKRMFEAA